MAGRILRDFPQRKSRSENPDTNEKGSQMMFLQQGHSSVLTEQQRNYGAASQTILLLYIYVRILYLVQSLWMLLFEAHTVHSQPSSETWQCAAGCCTSKDISTELRNSSGRLCLGNRAIPVWAYFFTGRERKAYMHWHIDVNICVLASRPRFLLWVWRLCSSPIPQTCRFTR